MPTVPARFLKPPSVQYGKFYEAPVRDGSWNLAQVKSFFKAGEINKLPIAVINAGKSSAWPFKTPMEFGELMTQQLGKLGLKIAKGALAVDRDCTMKNLRERLITARDNKWPIVIVLLPEMNALLYNTIKRMGEVEVGINTVCCVWEKAKKMSQQYAANIATKVNAKLGGINHRIHDKDFKDLGFPRGNLLVLGADVIHPTAASDGMLGCPSVAAVVGSIDSSFATYLPSVRAQRSRQEASSSKFYVYSMINANLLKDYYLDGRSN